MSAIEQAVARMGARQNPQSQSHNNSRKQEEAVSRLHGPADDDFAANERFDEPQRPVAASTSRDGYFELPYDQLDAEGLVAAAGTRNQLSEEYRAIKRPILSAIDIARYDGIKNSNLVMVTSCVSGEGKTFSAINLAISIAMERDRTVLLIDGDVTNPSAGERLGFPPKQRGLTDVLLNPNLRVEDVVCQSDIKNLKFLPAGSSTHHVTELLSSRAMRELMDDLSQSYKDRVIIFDTAPILLTSEASIIADLAGQIVFVVAAESTTQGMVSDALKMINNHSRVGYVLNKTRKKQSNIYGYGYGYGYGHK